MHEIRVVTKGKDYIKIGPKAFRDFIIPFVKERARISVQKVPSLAQERLWLKARARELDKKLAINVLLFVDGKLAGNCLARRSEMYSERHNVHFGLSISKPYRGMGWGEKLLRTTIREARLRFKSRQLWIEPMDGNVPARRLYKKVGFVQIGRLSDYEYYYGRYKDKILMQYKPKKKTR